MKPQGSEYAKEVSLEEAVKHYDSGETVVIRFHDKDWYAAYTQNRYQRHLNMLGDITLDMLPHARYFIKGDSNE